MLHCWAVNMANSQVLTTGVDKVKAVLSQNLIAHSDVFWSKTHGDSIAVQEEVKSLFIFWEQYNLLS